METNKRKQHNTAKLWLACAIIVCLHFTSRAQTNITQTNIDIPYGVEVNSYNGNLFYQQTLISLPAIGMSIDFSLSYNSQQANEDKGFGNGWASNYNMHYDTKPDGSIQLNRSDGQQHLFQFDGTAFLPPAGTFETLEQYQSGQYRLTLRDGTKYYFDNAIHKKLTTVEDRNGNTTTFTYNGNGQLISISSSCGANLSLQWTNNHLSKITDATESPVREYSFSYNAQNQLTQCTDPLGNSELYTYNSEGLLQNLTNKNGNTLSITYDTYGAVANLQTPITNQSLSYNAATRTTIFSEQVDGNTQSTTYKYNEQKQLIQKIGTCCGFNSQYQYDDQGNLTQMMDANGNITSYTYNFKGQVINETDPLGNNIQYIYEPVFNQLASVIDKNGNLTMYTYDSNGNLTQKMNSLYTESYTYDADGKRTTSTDGKGNITSYTYDACGQMTGITEPLGRSTVYAYNKRGELESETNPNGCTASYTYDLLSRMISSTDALANTSTYGYDALGNQTTITDPRNDITTYQYDRLNRTIAINQPLGISTQYTYNEKNRTATTDPNGNTTTFQYDDRNLLIAEIDTENITRSFTYDAKGNRISSTDGNGNISTFQYDARDQLKKVTDALGGKVTYSYDANGNQISINDQLGNITQMQYDALDRQIKTVNALGGIATTAYDNNSNQIETVDENGNATTYAYDALDRLTTVTDALNNPVTFVYDAYGNQLSQTDANGNTTSQVYDCLNRMVSTTNAENESTTYGYDANSNQTQVNTAGGNTIQYGYDALNRITQITDNLGVLAVYTYDDNGNVLSEIDGNGNSTSITYDGINRSVSQTDAMGESTTIVYDGNSNVISQTDRNDNTVSMEYDALNRQVKQTDALGYETLSTYNAASNLTQLTDAMGNSTAYEYDNLYRLTKEIYADGTEKIFTYDAVGNVMSRTDNKGAITQYNYDNLYRLINRNYPDSNDDNFSYDAAGRMLTANNSNANITFTYDDVNRLQSETLNGKSTGYLYDIANRRRTLTYPSDRIIMEKYDKRNRLSILYDGVDSLATWQYDLDNRNTQKNYLNGVGSAYMYNANNWTTQIIHNKGFNFANLVYTHDKEGNKTSSEFLHKTDHSEKYSYDAKYRLTDFEKGTLVNGNINTPITQTQYNMDALGNRINVNTDGNTTTYATNEMNEYTQITPSILSPTNDDNGNLISDGSGKAFEYDYENRLVAIAYDGGATFSTIYKYDALGRRIEKEVSGVTTNYYYDSARVIEEQSNTTTNTFAYGTWIDDVVNMQRNGQNYFYHQNHLGSVVAVTDDNGNVAEQYEYNAYGKVTIYDTNFNTQTTSTINNPYLFTGRRFDPESNLYYYRARHYAPATGRFMQRDPLGYVDGMNLFDYVGGNGINWVDPLGLKKECCILKTYAGHEKKVSFKPEKQCCLKNKNKVVDQKTCPLVIYVGHRLSFIFKIPSIKFNNSALKFSAACCKAKDANELIRKSAGEKYVESNPRRKNEYVFGDKEITTPPRIWKNPGSARYSMLPKEIEVKHLLRDILDDEIANMYNYIDEAQNTSISGKCCNKFVIRIIGLEKDGVNFLKRYKEWKGYKGNNEIIDIPYEVEDHLNTKELRTYEAENIKTK